MTRVLVACLVAAAAPLAAQNPPTPAPARSAAALKIAYVNAQQVLQATPGYAAAESTFNREVQGYRDELQKLQAQLDSSVQAYDQQSIALSPAAKQQKQKDLQQLQQRLEQRTNDLNQKAQQRQQELMAPIQQNINTIIQAIRLEEGYALIFNSDPSVSGIIAADPALDITQKVIARLQQAQKSSQ